MEFSVSCLAILKEASPVAIFCRSEMYSRRYSPLLSDYPLSSRTTIGRESERDSEFYFSNRSLSGSQSFQIPRIGMLEERSHSPYEATQGPSLSYGRVGLRTEEQYPSAIQAAAPASSASYARLGTSLNPDVRAGVAGQQAPRPQIRFDPFTGEPYKFDPFTGEPIHHPDTSTMRPY